MSSWEVGTTHTITWISTGEISHVNIDLYRDNSLIDNITTHVGNDGSYTWSIPNNSADSINYQIKISSFQDSFLSDYSGYFEISGNSNKIDEPSPNIFIPGFNFYLLFGIIGVTTVILLKKQVKN